MSLKSGAIEKIKKETLVKLSGGAGCPNFTYRPHSKYTTYFGWDFGTTINDVPFPRFHRATDRGAKPADIFAPVTFDGALMGMNAGDFGNLLRLFYADNENGWELRIAHMRKSTDLDLAFLKLASVVQDKKTTGGFALHSFTGLKPIPAGTRLGKPGDYGLSAGIHTHTELVSSGGRNKELDALLELHKKPRGLIYKVGTTGFRDYLAEGLLSAKGIKLTDAIYNDMLNYLVLRGYTYVGPYEAHGWDGRTNSNSVWYDSKSTLVI